MLGSYLLYHSKNEKTRQNYDRSRKSYQLSHCDNLLRDIKYALRAFTLFVFRVSMVSERDGPACQHLLSQAQRIRKKVCINETEPGNRLQSSFNKVAVFIAIFQKPKNNLYDTVFRYFNRLWSIEIII